MDDSDLYNLMYMFKSPSVGPGDERAISPAVNILQSTEKVVSAIASTLPKDENSSTISRPNLGKSDPTSNNFCWYLQHRAIV